MAIMMAAGHVELYSAGGRVLLVVVRILIDVAVIVFLIRRNAKSKEAMTWLPVAITGCRRGEWR